MIWRETGHREDAFTESDLKICDLCGSLNLAENGECFVCSWHGRFETKCEVVRVAMDLLKRRHGEIKAEYLTDGLTCRIATARGLRGWLLRTFVRARHWLFG